MKAIAFIICFFYALGLSAQDNNRLRISLLTCSPGEELYSTFGHSAMRVIDSNAVTDLVYNFGTFDFGDKDFYTKFIRGKLMYFESLEMFEDFATGYRLENRSITEQVLNLSAADEQQFKDILNETLKEENRYYKYDFVLDNCTTRLRDLIEKYTDSASSHQFVMPVQSTFRDGIHKYLDAGDQQWSKLGIDILLGAKLDRKMTARQQQFLPDNLMFALDSAQGIVAQKEMIVPAQNPVTSKSIFSPIIIFSVIAGLLIILSITLRNRSFNNTLSKTVFMISGLMGFFLLFMWFFTDHAMTKNNYNLLWAVPTHLFFAFSRRSAVAKGYFKLSFILHILTILLFFFLPQKMNPAILPFIILLAWGAYIRVRNNQGHAINRPSR